MFGAVTLMAAPSERLAYELMATELLPVTLAPSVTAEPAAVLAVSVTSLPVIKPVVEMLVPLALKVNAEAAPELLAFRVTVLPAVSRMFTVPEDLAVRLVAFSVPAVLKSIPPVPAVRFAVGVARLPVALMPPAGLEALRVNDVAELAPS